MNKPWYLWEGAAVRLQDGRVGVLMEIGQPFSEVGMPCCEVPMSYSTDQLIPESNPAVMLAPEWAMYVHITDSGSILFFIDPPTETSRVRGGIDWPQCPDHLKGKTWPLPGRK